MPQVGMGRRPERLPPDQLHRDAASSGGLDQKLCFLLPQAQALVLMNDLSRTADSPQATSYIASVPAPLQYTQLGIGLTALLCSVVQLLQGEAGDLYIVAALLGTAMTYYALRWHILAQAPLSALALIGCGLCNFYLPLTITTFEGKPVTFELQRPDLTFGFNLLAFGVLIAVHIVYLQSSLLQGARFALSQRILRPLGIFVVPSPPQLFVLGAIGLGSMVFFYLVLGVTTGETFGSVGLKTLEGLFWLAYAPYLLFLYPILGRDHKPVGSYVVPLLIFSGAMLMVGSARNSRTAVFVGLVGVLLGVVLGGWLGVIPEGLFRMRNLCAGGLLVVILLPLATQLGASMVAVRSDRHQASPSEVLRNTFSALLSGDSTQTYEHARLASDEVARWHGGAEHYLDSMLFGRLCNLRFADNTLTVVASLDAAGRSSIAAREWQRSLSIMPQPVLDALGAGIDKEASQGSMGSFIYYLSSGRPELLYQHGTGSYLASGWAAFGWLLPLCLGFLGVALFVILDSFSIPRSLASETVIAAVAAMGLFGTFTLFTSAAGAPESVAVLLHVLVRKIPEQTLIYITIFWLLRQLALR
jgi:hypothetical protein